MNACHPLVLLVAVAVGGLCVGCGLVVGAFVARAVRRYVKDEGGPG